MGGGKGGSTTVNTPSLTQEQKDQIKAQTEFFTGTIKPSYEQAVRGATDIYTGNAGGTLNAAQNQARTALQAQEALGGTGESALRTGISGLENLFGKDYEQNQVAAALMPAQSQYMQNLAGQQSLFGGAGQLGSARQALAGQQLAGQTMATQAQTAAQVANQIAGQRASAANQLAQLGQGGIGQALGAAGNAVSASMVPQQLYNQYASVIFGTPSASYTPDFRGTQGNTQTKSEYNVGLDFSKGLGGAVLGGLLASSDRRLKENVKHIRDVDGIKVYSFNYIWDKTKTPIIGAMAQDLLEDNRYARAVRTDKHGYYMVDYGKLPELQ
jgi:hypothetical protein